MSENEKYPDWLYRDLVEDSLPWESKSPYELKEFLGRYTLHDSYWVGCFSNVAFNQDAILAFQWDSVWLPDNIKKSAPQIDEWSYLFLKLSGVTEISTANYKDVLGMSRAIGGVEVELIDGKYHLAIDDVYGGQVNVLYQGRCAILALNPDRSVLII